MERETGYEAAPEYLAVPEIRHVEQVVPGGFRVTWVESTADVPESWAFADDEGHLLVIDPGGEIPPATESGTHPVRDLMQQMPGVGGEHKIAAIRQLAQETNSEVSAVLLTHGDADHTNNIEQITDTSAPIYIGRQGRWSVLSPEKQFTASVMNMRKSRLTGNEAGELPLRDLGLQVLGRAIGNERTSDDPVERHARKAAMAERFQDFPETFSYHGGEIRPIALPGHAPEETGFYLPEYKTLIMGDLITTSKPARATRANLFLTEANAHDALQTLQAISRLDLERLYVAHGPPLLGAEVIRTHLDQMIGWLSEHIERIERLHTDQPQLTTGQIARAVFGREMVDGFVEREAETYVYATLVRSKSSTERKVEF